MFSEDLFMLSRLAATMITIEIQSLPRTTNLTTEMILKVSRKESETVSHFVAEPFLLLKGSK